MTQTNTQMLINYVPGEECRIAIARNGRLEEFYQERASTESHVGNIYKGRVTNVESSIQAAFIDFGLDRNGFLHISDLHPMYFPGKDREEFERVGSKTPHRRRPPIQACLKKGQEVLVQVLKEGIGTKGPTLTSYLSIPGRFLVMMPNMQRLGVSRRVDDDESRHATRKILAELDPPEGFGFIVRTAGIGQTKTDLKRDLAYLQRLWKNIERRRKSIGRVGELYTESDLIIRTIRDVFSNDIDRVIVDDATAARRAHDFLTIASPRAQSKVVYYNDPVPLFHRFGIETQIDHIHQREVPLPSGGSLVIDSAEALVAIDVNSGKSRDARDAESNAFNTNKEAVDEIARQLRLRDLGGVIVNDLIDMRDLKHRKQIETRMRQALKDDRARTRVGAISQFGLLEMTRQRMRPSLRTSHYNACHACDGFGYVKSAESVVIDVMRRLRLAMQHPRVERIELTISPDVAFQLLNRKRGELVRLEQRHGKSVMVRVGGHRLDFVNLAAYDARGIMDLETLTKPDGLPDEADNAFIELEQGTLPPEVEAELEQAQRDADDEAQRAADAEQAHVQAVLAGDLPAEAAAPTPTTATAASTTDADAEDAPARKSRRRRRGGRGRRKKKGQEAQETQETQEGQEGAAPADEAVAPPDSAEESDAAERVELEQATDPDAAGDEDTAPKATTTKKKRKSKRGSRKRKKAGDAPETDADDRDATSESPDPNQDQQDQAPAPDQAQAAQPPADDGESEAAATDGDGATRRKRRRRGGRGRRRTTAAAQSGNGADGANGDGEGGGDQGGAGGGGGGDEQATGYANRLVDVPETGRKSEGDA